MGQVTCDKKQKERYSRGGNVVVDECGIQRRNYVEWDDKPLLYISGPMVSEGNPYTNIYSAVLAAQYARHMGWAVIIPHLDCLFAMISNIKDADYYIDNDLNQLDRCDAVLVLPFKVEYKDGRQTGTSTELDFAEDRNIPVYTVETLPHAIDFDRSQEV